MVAGRLPPAVADGAIVALSLLRLGPDTRAPAELKGITENVDGLGMSGMDALALLEQLAQRVVPEAERPRLIARARQWANAALDRASKAGIGVMPWFSDGYPQLLREIADPPILLWTAGDAAILSDRAVAVVGSRRATPAGLAVARQLSCALAEAGCVIVSGLARGIDGAAHEGALEAGGRTIAVVGCGVDVVYPPEHRDLFRRIAASGLVVSEFPPGMPPLAHHFPLRNRIISGISWAVVVVEASERSGSLITARLALEQGREVLAVPGNVASGRYAGGHALIKDGAALVENVEDVLRALGWSPAAWPDRGNAPNDFDLSTLERSMAVGEVYLADELLVQTGYSTSTLLAELSSLELTGRVVRVAGGGFMRIDKSAIGGRNG